MPARMAGPGGHMMGPNGPMQPMMGPNMYPMGAMGGPGCPQMMGGPPYGPKGSPGLPGGGVEAAQPLPPSDDPRYAAQFHSFQQQLYATPSRHPHCLPQQHMGGMPQMGGCPPGMLPQGGFYPPK